MQILAGRSQTHGNSLVIMKVGKRVLGRLFLTGTSDFGKVEWTSANFLRNRRPWVSNSARNVQISALRYTVLEKRRDEIYSSQCIGKFCVDFNEDVHSKWVKRHMKYTVCGGSFFDKECKI